MNKICLGIPNIGTIKTLTFTSVVSLMWQSKMEFVVIAQMSCYLHQNREIIAGRSLTDNCSHLLFVDSDMIFGGDALLRLMADGKDIICGFYNKRELPRVSTMKMADKDGNFIDMKTKIPGKPFKVAAAGTGFMLIKTDVFRKLDQPWFAFEGNMGEDVYFCRKATAAGYEIWCDPAVTVGHIGDYIY